MYACSSSRIEGPITSSATPVLESGVAVLLSGGLARTATVV